MRWFADAWMGRPVELEDGCTADELAAVEADLGFELPAALREGYALIGRRDDLTRQQDPLVRPPGLYVDDALGGVLVFRRENQDCAFWGIPLSQVDQDDPPVVVESHQGWIPFLDRMSLVWVELVLSESLFAVDSLYDACELPDALMPGLHARYARVGLPDHPMWASDNDSPVRWYAAPAGWSAGTAFRTSPGFTRAGARFPILRPSVTSSQALGSAEVTPAISMGMFVMGTGQTITQRARRQAQKRPRNSSCPPSWPPSGLTSFSLRPSLVGARPSA
ncbi:hypothetical protein ACFY0P_51995 [Streptomyces sp. NPDC001714]|uniref:hypothetical protein n=1 Tax=Streptomyces sp. NPDC001714 TaxID=3364603 RepID=UPI0036D0E47A